ncbi:MAG: ATP-binding protein [Candidatus Eisenbacteria bacterium]|nr:ATP-binding protein [Candidatus Eisenbacteria bacterium]
MDELVIISGKGGTGKTSVAASLAVLASGAVIADCDVDAADLHLVLSPTVRERHEFLSGNEAVIRPDECTRCGLCHAYCRFGGVTRESGGGYAIDPTSCEGCGVCVRFCPARAIDFPERRCGEWMVSDTRCGPMVHARLGVAAENSGKLVTTVRREAQRIAKEEDRSLIIVDGPPGIGCPVIASVVGASTVLAVTEPTVSGSHDLERLLALTKHFGIPTAVCVNKWDINPAMTAAIELKARETGARAVGRIRYDTTVTRAQVAGKTVVEMDGPAKADIIHVWDQIRQRRGTDGER